MFKTFCNLAIGSVLVFFSASGVRADEPLHVQVNALIVGKIQGIVAEKTTDAEFARRIYLDLAGRIPSVAEARAFLANTASDKRTKLCDQLLSSPEYATRMADAFHVLLMERQGDDAEWRKFLTTSFATSKPWDQMVREMIYADANDEVSRGGAFFFSKRLENYGQNPVDYPGLVRDVGRLFLGLDVQCAQCHDHLFVKEYKQEFFQGLFAFVGQASPRKDVKFPAVAEKVMDKKVEFTSVFVQEPKATGPRLPGGTEIDVPVFTKGQEFETPPDKAKNFPGTPKFSPLKLLAEQLPRAENPAFSRNIVNRVWFLLMGRGLVWPLDLHHADNPPSHPELLDLLSRELVAHKFDLKWLIRELTLTDVYQRSTVMPADVPEKEVAADSYRVALERPLSAEQLLLSALQATGELPRATTNAADFDKLRERFAKSLANPPKEPEIEFAPSVKGALFLAHDEVLLSWLQPRAGNLAERLSQLTDATQIADELFVATFTRPATEDEQTAVGNYLSQRSSDRTKAIANLIWANLSATEFALIE